MIYMENCITSLSILWCIDALLDNRCNNHASDMRTAGSSVLCIIWAMFVCSSNRTARKSVFSAVHFNAAYKAWTTITSSSSSSSRYVSVKRSSCWVSRELWPRHSDSLGTWWRRDKSQLNMVLHSYNLSRIVKFPTRFGLNCYTTIDNIFLTYLLLGIMNYIFSQMVSLTMKHSC
jgi:hypothetical protein